MYYKINLNSIRSNEFDVFVMYIVFAKTKQSLFGSFLSCCVRLRIYERAICNAHTETR